MMQINFNIDTTKYDKLCDYQEDELNCIAKQLFMDWMQI